jgi:hypothetical protein
VFHIAAKCRAYVTFHCQKFVVEKFQQNLKRTIQQLNPYLELEDSKKNGSENRKFCENMPAWG